MIFFGRFLDKTQSLIKCLSIKHKLIAIVVFGSLLRIFDFWLTPYVAEDSPIYLDMARILVSDGGAVSFDLMPRIPPFWVWCLALFEFIGMSPLIGVYILGLLANASIIILVFLIARRVVSSNRSLLASLLIAIHPQMFRFTFEGLRETVFIPIVLLVLHLILSYLQNNKEIQSLEKKCCSNLYTLVLIGVLTAISFATRQEGMEVFLWFIGALSIIAAINFNKSQLLNQSIDCVAFMMSFGITLYVIVSITNTYKSSIWFDRYIDKAEVFLEKLKAKALEETRRMSVPAAIVNMTAQLPLTKQGDIGKNPNKELIKKRKNRKRVKANKWDASASYFTKLYKSAMPRIFSLFILLFIIMNYKTYLKKLKDPIVLFLTLIISYLVFTRLLMFIFIQEGGVVRYLCLVSILGVIPTAAGVESLSVFLKKRFHFMRLVYLLIFITVLISVDIIRSSEPRPYIHEMSNIITENKSPDKLVYGINPDDCMRVNYYSGIQFFPPKHKALPLKKLIKSNKPQDFYYISEKNLAELEELFKIRPPLKVLYEGEFDDEPVYLYQGIKLP